MDEILYLEADEEITSVVDKIKGLDAKSIGLVAPKGATIVQSVVSLKLLKKQAEDLGRKIAIITSDDVGRSLASRVGLLVFADTKSAEPLEIAQEEIPDVRKIVEIDMSDKETKLPKDFEIHRYDQESNQGQSKEEATEEPKADKSRQPISSNKETIGFTNRPIENKERHERVERQPFKSAETVEKKVVPQKNKGRRRGWLVAVVALGLIAVVFLVDLVFAKVEVNISIPAEELDGNVSVVVERDKSEPDVVNGIIPGKQIQKEEEFSENFVSTGEKDAGEKATGTLTFKNESGVDESIDAGTTIASSSGMEFTLQTSLTVPKATLNPAGDKVLGQVSGEVEAKSAGDSYNLPASTSYTVYGNSKISVSGGTSGGITKKIKIVSNSDIVNSQEKLQEQGKTALLEAISKEGNNGVVEGAEKVEVVSFASTKNAEDEASEFKATAKVRVITLSYNLEQLRQVALKQIEKTLKEGEGILTTKDDKFEISLDSSDINVGKVTLKVAVSTHAGQAVDLTDLSSAWRVKTLSQIRQQASQIPEAQVKDVTIWPKYALPIAPILKNRIIINLEYVKK